jgi:hypothetical protein
MGKQSERGVTLRYEQTFRAGGVLVQYERAVSAACQALVVGAIERDADVLARSVEDLVGNLRVKLDSCAAGAYTRPLFG